MKSLPLLSQLSLPVLGQQADETPLQSASLSSYLAHSSLAPARSELSCLRAISCESQHALEFPHTQSFVSLAVEGVPGTPSRFSAEGGQLQLELASVDGGQVTAGFTLDHLPDTLFQQGSSRSGAQVSLLPNDDSITDAPHSFLDGDASLLAWPGPIVSTGSVSLQSVLTIPWLPLPAGLVSSSSSDSSAVGWVILPPFLPLGSGLSGDLQGLRSVSAPGQVGEFVLPLMTHLPTASPFQNMPRRVGRSMFGQPEERGAAERSIARHVSNWSASTHSGRFSWGTAVSGSLDGFSVAESGINASTHEQAEFSSVL